MRERQRVGLGCERSGHLARSVADCTAVAWAVEGESVLEEENGGRDHAFGRIVVSCSPSVPPPPLSFLFFFLPA